MTACQSCGAAIKWVRMQGSGKPMPLDAKPTGKGTIVLLSENPPVARVVALNEGAVGLDHYQSHFATCPDAARFRKKRASSSTG